MIALHAQEPRPGRDAPPAIFLMGTTAAGKTSLAVELVRRLPVDIISVDSGQVYRGMDIGTAKPGPAVLEVAPHRLIDLCDPGEAYSAARFREDALREMAEIVDAGRVPLLVGGTMLYFRALERGLSELPAADPGLRRRLEADAHERGWSALHRRLTEVDPESAARIHPNDPQRIQRALEVYDLTGAPLSRLQGATTPRPFPYRVWKVGLSPGDRTVLHRRVEQRFRDMLARGLEQEVRALYGRGDLHRDLPSVRAVGYRQMWAWLEGRCTREEAVARAVVATRQLAKRQLTRLRADREVRWFDSEARGIGDKVLKFLNNAPKYV